MDTIHPFQRAPRYIPSRPHSHTILSEAVCAPGRVGSSPSPREPPSVRRYRHTEAPPNRTGRPPFGTPRADHRSLGLMRSSTIDSKKSPSGSTPRTETHTGFTGFDPGPSRPTFSVTISSCRWRRSRPRKNTLRQIVNNQLLAAPYPGYTVPRTCRPVGTSPERGPPPGPGRPRVSGRSDTPHPNAGAPPPRSPRPRANQSFSRLDHELKPSSVCSNSSAIVGWPCSYAASIPRR